MKLFKKTAALLFCLALVFSVMAISASAEDNRYVVYLKYNGAKLGNGTVTLHDYDKDTYFEISLPDADNALPSEVDEITFDIMMGTTLTGDAAKVNSFNFKITAETGLTYKSGWMGASSTNCDVFMKPGSGSSTENAAGYYTFTAGGPAKLAVPGTIASPEKVGEITFTIGSNLTPNTEIAPQLTAAEIKPQVGTAVYVPNTSGTIGMISVKDDNDNETATQGIKANPEYTLTFQHKQNNQTTNIIEDKTGTGATSTATYYYSTGLAKSALPAWVPINAYRAGNNNANQDGSYTAEWEVRTLDADVDNTNDGWTVGEQFDVNGTDGVIISAGKVGAVTLEAVHTPIEYTATFVLDEAKSTVGYHGDFKKDANPVTYATGCVAYTNANGNGYTHTYTVENLYDNDAQIPAATNYLGIATAPTRNGYEFVNWTAAKTDSNDTDFNTTWLDEAYTVGESPDTETYYNKDKVNSVVGLYGDVTFTAVWSVDGFEATASYQYAGSGSALVLFAVPQAKVISGVYNVTAGSGSAVAMFDVLPARYEETVKAVYSDLDTTNDKVFAYIVELVGTAPNKTPPTLTFTVTENAADATGEDVHANTQILYDGNVFKDNADKINAADYGNVNSLLVNNDQFTVAQFNVQARLEADMVTGGTKFGSIEDVYAIIKLLGATPSGTRATS